MLQAAQLNEQEAVSARGLFGIAPKSDAASLLLTEILVKIAVKLSKRKATCHWEDESWEKKAERALFSAFVLRLDGSQSRSFWHLSECNSSERYFVQMFNTVRNKLPVSIRHRSSCACTRQAPDPNQTPGKGTEVFAWQARCAADAASPQKRSKQKKEDDGMAASAVCGPKFRALEAIRESESMNSSLV